MTNKLKVRVEDRGHGDVTIHLPPLPPEMDGDHDIMFDDGDRVIFGLMLFRYKDGNVLVEMFDPNKSAAIYSHEFKEKRAKS